MLKTNDSRIRLLFNLSLPLILILQISLGGLTFSSEADSHGAIENCYDSSYSEYELCVEDAEDKNLKFPDSSLDLYDPDSSKLISSHTITPNNYLHSLNHSRSPPVL